jgi:hypothetical protein
MIVGLMAGHVARLSGGRSTLRGSSAPTKIRHAATSPLLVNDVRAISEINCPARLLALRPQRPVPERNADRLAWSRRDDAGPTAPDCQVRSPRQAWRPVRGSLWRLTSEELVLHAFAGEVTRLWPVNVRFAPKADIRCSRSMSALTPIADISRYLPVPHEDYHSRCLNKPRT